MKSLLAAAADVSVDAADAAADGLAAAAGGNATAHGHAAADADAASDHDLRHAGMDAGRRVVVGSPDPQPGRCFRRPAQCALPGRADDGSGHRLPGGVEPATLAP